MAEEKKVKDKTVKANSFQDLAYLIMEYNISMEKKLDNIRELLNRSIEIRLKMTKEIKVIDKRVTDLEFDVGKIKTKLNMP